MRGPADTASGLRGGAWLRRFALREWLLALGFALIVVAGVLTVALPELSKEPETEPGATQQPAGPRK